MLVDDSIELPVQIKGKVRGRVVVPSDADADEIKMHRLGGRAHFVAT